MKMGTVQGYKAVVSKQILFLLQLVTCERNWELGAFLRLPCVNLVLQWPQPKVRSLSVEGVEYGLTQGTGGVLAMPWRP